MLRWPEGLDPARFLAEYWQKRPCLLRGFFPGFETPLSPDELAGLACEPDVESRLVIEAGETPWEVRAGPFAPEDFGQLGEAGWTLLVQDVEKHLPDLAWITESLGFLPRWRIDDLMISFAPPGGSVGPHVDAYDVFLLQGHGRRRWQLDTSPASLATLPGPEIAVLADFHPHQTFELDPGDALYLPPGVAHHGIALSACMTYSIGFRAPGRRELIESLAGYLAARAPEHARFSDPDLTPDEVEGGLISPRALERARRDLGPLAAGVDDLALAEWFGALVTEPKLWLQPDSASRPCAKTLEERGRRGLGLVRHGMAILARAEAGGLALLFACGRCWRLPGSLWPQVSLLAERRAPTAEELQPLVASPEGAALLADLVEFGVFCFPEDEEPHIEEPGP
ncbi:MAG: cupin domain-containing protein [Gammaproteobacteria bacterium]